MKIRTLLMLLVSVSILLGITGCSGGENASTENGKVEIRFSWWGDTSRNEMYNKIVDRFEEKYSNITVKRQFGGWTDYWDKLATQIAGGNAPDVVSMHQFYVADYARRDALLNLNELVESNTINLKNFPQSTVDSGKIGDNIYMIAKGITMSGFVYNTALFDELGVDYPKMNWTWEDFTNKVIELNNAFKSEGHWGVADFSGGQLQPNFRYFVRQKGKDLFTDDGQLAFEKKDLVEWWTMWDQLRQQGAIPDAATTTEYEGTPLEQNLFVTGKTALQQIPANQIYLYQEQFDKGEIRIVRIPTRSDGKNGEFIEGAYLSIAKESEHPEAAAKFINFFVNSKEALELFKVEQGPPANTEMVNEVVKPLLEPAQERAVEFIEKTVEYAHPAPYSPLGVNEVEQAFADSASAIGFGELTVEEAADKFMEEANSILK